MSLEKETDKVQNIILPIQLTMIYGSGICHYCTNPTGDTRTYNMNVQVDPSNKIGFYTCGKDECQKYMKKYIKSLFSNIYKTQLWNSILSKIANRTFVSVLRSNGNIDTDWKLKFNVFSDSNEKIELLEKNPLNKSFLTAILCIRYNYNINVPSEIWEHIYNMALESYTPYVNLIISRGLEKYITVYKDNINPLLSIEKQVDITTLV